MLQQIFKVFIINKNYELVTTMLVCIKWQIHVHRIEHVMNVYIISAPFILGGLSCLNQLGFNPLVRKIVFTRLCYIYAYHREPKGFTN